MSDFANDASASQRAEGASSPALAPSPSPSPPALATSTSHFLPLLITGVAGVAGYNAFHYFRERYGSQVIGIRRRDNWPLSLPGIVPCDGDDADELARLFDRHQFAAVLNAEGTCKLKSCELDPAMARRINVTSIETLLRQTERAGVRLVHLSIDLVFSGTRGGGHVEDDETDPVTIYGQTMVEAEELLSAERPDAALLRISLPMGVSFNGHAGAIDWIQHRFKKGRPATLYYDEVRTPTYTDCLNPLLATLLARHDIRGIFHAGGPRRLSLYEIAQIVNRVGGYDPQRLPPRLPAPRSGSIAAAGWGCEHEQQQTGKSPGLRSRSIPGRCRRSGSPTAGSGTTRDRAARRSCFARVDCVIAIRGYTHSAPLPV
jgi:dTDP-4-dehydrorhamnose reductase